MESQCHRFASNTPRAYLLLESWTTCFDMKEDRSKKSALVCDGWSAFLEVASDLVRDTYSKWKSITWLTSSHEEVEWTDLFRDMGFERAEKDWRQNFFLLPRGRGVMAIMVGSFTLQLPTSASVATLLAFAKPWGCCTCFRCNISFLVKMEGAR